MQLIAKNENNLPIPIKGCGETTGSHEPCSRLENERTLRIDEKIKEAALLRQLFPHHTRKMDRTISKGNITLIKTGNERTLHNVRKYRQTNRHVCLCV